jgi:hypothetical protein
VFSSTPGRPNWTLLGSIIQHEIRSATDRLGLSIDTIRVAALE